MERRNGEEQGRKHIIALWRGFYSARMLAISTIMERGGGAGIAQSRGSMRAAGGAGDMMCAAFLIV
jgi:hypothetical protein